MTQLNIEEIFGSGRLDSDILKVASRFGDHLASAVSATSCALIISDATATDNPIIFANAAFTALTGYDTPDVIGRNCRFLQGVDTDPFVIGEIRTALSAGQAIRREVLNYRSDGEPFWNDLMIDPIRDAIGQLVGFVGVQYKTTAGQAARDREREAEFRLNTIITNLPGYIFRRVLRPDGTIEAPYFGTLVRDILGLPKGQMPTPEDFYRRVHRDDRDQLQQAIAQSAVDMSLFSEEFRLISSTGIIHWFRSTALPRRLPDENIVWDGFALEITGEKSAEAQLAFLTLHDSLTGLSNRSRFTNALRKTLETRSHDDGLTAVFFIDIDAFQDVNDRLGQTAGDEVLQAIGKRLELFAGTAGTVARLGGDEFAVLLPIIGPATSAAAIAAAISANLAEVMHVARQSVAIQVCIGVAVYPSALEMGQGAAVDASAELMKQAGVALQTAKQDGVGARRVYVPDIDDRARNRATLRSSLGDAIGSDQFKLYYQPLVAFGTGEIVGAEALVRWDHPDLGLQRPDLFIPLAEVSGLIVPLGRWIMTAAMRQGQAWRNAGLATPSIAINVSSVQLQKPNFIDDVEQALDETGANPADYEFELTEGLAIEASTKMLAIMGHLKSLGFKMAIDDFGTGHATFRYLRDFPVDKVKIDQMFIRQLVIDSNDAIIVRAIIALANSLGVQIVAEGVETLLQHDFLKSEGCGIGQGYFYSMPLEPEDFGWMLRNHIKLPRSSAYPPPLQMRANQEPP